MSDRTRAAVEAAEKLVEEREREALSESEGNDPHTGKSPAELAKLVRR